MNICQTRTGNYLHLTDDGLYTLCQKFAGVLQHGERRVLRECKSCTERLLYRVS